jgi:hypothetical protein
MLVFFKDKIYIKNSPCRVGVGTGVFPAANSSVLGAGGGLDIVGGMS